MSPVVFERPRAGHAESYRALVREFAERGGRLQSEEFIESRGEVVQRYLIDA